MSMQAQVERQTHQKQRHDSAAHLLAEAMQELFPAAQLINTHANVGGFICEIALEHALSPADLATLEQHMAQMIARNLPCTRAYWSRPQALDYLRKRSG